MCMAVQDDTVFLYYMAALCCDSFDTYAYEGIWLGGMKGWTLTCLC